MSYGKETNTESDETPSGDAFVNLATDYLNPRQFSICDLDKININETDINKYNMKKIQAKPLDSNDKNLDHLCFTHLFPYGRGGMFDNRPIPVKPAMYYR